MCFLRMGRWFFRLITCIANIGEFSSIQALLHYRQGSASIEGAFSTWLNPNLGSLHDPHVLTDPTCKSSLAACVSRLSISCPAHQLHPSSCILIEFPPDAPAGQDFSSCENPFSNATACEFTCPVSMRQMSSSQLFSKAVTVMLFFVRPKEGRFTVAGVTLPNRKHVHLSCFSN